MTDSSNNVSRFADGEPVGSLREVSVLDRLRAFRAYHPWLHVLEIFAVWFLILGVFTAFFWFMFIIVDGRPAHAAEPQDPSVLIFEQPGECFIDIDLRVVGKKRAACVERLETAARLAKSEMLVNEPRKKSWVRK